MVNIWPYFQWATPELPDLGAALNKELKVKLAPFEYAFEREAYDPDIRSICWDWADELSTIIRNWCSVLQVQPDGIIGYDMVGRSGARLDLMSIDGIAEQVISILSSRNNGDDTVLRPMCLEQANQEIMNWLARHPEHVDRVHHRTFESIVAEIIKMHGWEVQLTKRTRDGGYDLMCLKMIRLDFR